MSCWCSAWGFCKFSTQTYWCFGNWALIPSPAWALWAYCDFTVFFNLETRETSLVSPTVNLRCQEKSGFLTTWTDNYVPVSYWTSIEIEVGIVCVCMPAIQPLLKKFFPRVFSQGSTATISGRMSKDAKGLSSKGSKFSIKPKLDRDTHRELQSCEDLALDDHSSQHELVAFGGKDDSRSGTSA